MRCKRAINSFRRSISAVWRESCSSCERINTFNAAVSSLSRSSVEAADTFKLCHAFAHSVQRITNIFSKFCCDRYTAVSGFQCVLAAANRYLQ